MWHDVPNRGGRLTIVPAERATGDIGLSSGWQGDAAGRTVPGPSNDYVVVPVAKNPDGSAITGQVMARIINASGKASHPMNVYSNPMPYKPASLDTKEATLTTHASETIDGQIGATAEIAPADWAFAKCDADHPFPGTPDPTPDLPEERLRSEPALPGRVHREGPARARHRLRRVPRRRLVLQVCARRTMPARPIRSPAASTGRSPAASRSPATSSAASCISASTRTRPAASSMTARGRSSPAAASRSTSASPCPTACRGSTSPATKARSGGATRPIRSAACRRPASSTAATRPTPARRSSSTSAPPRSGA